MNVPVNMQRLLGQSLRSRVMSCHALCAIAESDVGAGQLDRAVKTVQSIRRLLGEISALTTEPDRISSTTALQLSGLLLERDGRTTKIEALLRKSGQYD
jgi:ATP/maltotriose-dependent transcriptional regulator MalT